MQNLAFKIQNSKLHLAGFVESWGKGTNNIVDDCLKLGLPEPEYKYTQHAIQVFLYKTTQKTTKEFILELLESNSKMTREDLALHIGVSSEAIKQHLAKLKKEQILERIGGRKDGYWKINIRGDE